ncbi:MAG TPA: twin-arginine translocase TatA/TatE family subunit [Actinobacteria bacterium]|nr:twin-arginine translocase TatA/TatE family subunit [Actinomycetota bacterium]
MPNLRWQELLIIVALVLLLFGAKRLPDAARGLGRSLRIFKAETKGLVDGEEDEESSADASGSNSAQPPAPPSAIEAPSRDAPPANSEPIEHDSGERSTETNNG